MGQGDGTEAVQRRTARKTSGLDKQTGCLQIKVNFLQRLVTKNALEAWQKLDDQSENVETVVVIVMRQACNRHQNITRRR
jgi:hypothetical protein